MEIDQAAGQVIKFKSKFSEQDKGSCWEWKGSFFSSGYGRIDYFSKDERAHRVSYRVYKGEIPDKLLVCHSCDNPKCVNPNHLFLGTHKDNMMDKTIKKRNNLKIGENHPSAKLSRKEANEIKDLLRCKLFSQALISRQYSVSQFVISCISRGTIWQ